MFGRVRCLPLFVCGTLLAGSASLAGTSAAEDLQSQNPPARGTFAVSATRDVETLITLTADDARLSDVAARLATVLGVPVSVSAAAANDLVTASFAQLPLEPALIQLAPRAYVDYELRQDKAVPLDVHLAGLDEPAPEPRFPATGILIEGNTEDVPRPGTDDPLKISFEDNRLTLEVNRQPLGVVIAAAAETLSVPFDIQDGADEIVDVSVIQVPPEVALLRLSPNVRVNVRADLYRGERVVQRIVVAPPSAR